MAKLGIEDGVTTSENPSFTAYERATKASLPKITSGGVAGEVSQSWFPPRSDFLLRSRDLSRNKGRFPMTTPSTCVLSFAKIGLDGGTRALAGTPG